MNMMTYITFAHFFNFNEFVWGNDLKPGIQPAVFTVHRELKRRSHFACVLYLCCMSASAEFAKGLAKAKENDHPGAIRHFTNVIALQKNHVEAYAERAVSYLHSGRLALSMDDMNRCVDIEPGNSYRYSCRAYLKAKMGDLDGAIADYETAVRLDPEDAIAYNNLGLAQEQQGYHLKAKRNFERSNKLVGYNPPEKYQQHSVGNMPDETTDSLKAQPQNSALTKKSVAKDVFTKRNSFKDFLRFIRNGFKIKP